MKVLVLGPQKHYETYMPDLPITQQVEIVYGKRSLPDEELAALYPDAEVICVDAVRTTTRGLIDNLPNLKMIHSEGVGFDRIDSAAAREKGVYVCNNPGSNAQGVAEHTVMMMLALMRSLLPNHLAMQAGEAKAALKQMVTNPLRELGDCTVGLVGFGHTAKAVAHLLHAFGTHVCYYAPHRRTAEEEAAYNVTYLPLEELRSTCDIISLHCPANAETQNLVDEAFLQGMKPSALLINTARGTLVNTAALRRGLEEGWLFGAGLDTLDQEPVSADHPLVALPPELQSRVVLSPHISGVTTAFYRRGHLNMWQNIAKVAAGERPGTVVNGL